MFGLTGRSPSVIWSVIQFQYAPSSPLHSSHSLSLSVFLSRWLRACFVECRASALNQHYFLFQWAGRGVAGEVRQLGTCMSNCNSSGSSISAWVIDGNIAAAAAVDEDEDEDGRFTGLVSSIVIIPAGHVLHNFSHAVGNARMLPLRCAHQICICLASKLHAACCNCDMCACCTEREWWWAIISINKLFYFKSFIESNLQFIKLWDGKDMIYKYKEYKKKHAPNVSLILLLYLWHY